MQTLNEDLLRRRLLYFSGNPLKKVLALEEEHALKTLISLWVLSYDVYQKLVYNVSFSEANGGDVLTEALHLHFSIGKYSNICHWGEKGHH